ncbi:hypothetical protein L7E55_00185 [Pelotomaculum isophthalicicum JI]|uniref:Uncharacterized protein n=1 Tax=Pelotomaculum isophthalicicum JI TaxID=947010 RepID=A0A9X4H3S0_9FIRM|nr:lipid II flippase MurJ [Pelotomaculum isophthalicicum]MDF9406788.1 hypothetical protein [Pelotomaculum isophthalicicum JI]
MGWVQKKLAVNSFFVASAQVITGLLGLGTQVLVVRKIGVSGVTDGFFVAYVIPDVVGGIVMSLALLVLLPRVVDKEGLSPYGRNLCWMFALLSAVILSIAALIVIVTNISLAAFLGPGLTEEGVKVAGKALSIMAPAIMLQGTGGVAIAMLQACNFFAAASLGRVFFMLGPFIAAVALVDIYGIYSLAWGVLAGSFSACIFLVLITLAVTGRPLLYEVWATRLEAVEITKGAVPVLFARCEGEAWGFVIRAVATTTLPGGVTLLVLVQKLANLLYLAGSSISTAAYPDIARESRFGSEGFIGLTRKRAGQIFLVMNVLAWPLAGVAASIMNMITNSTVYVEPSIAYFAPVCLSLFSIMAPWVSINGLIGNATWAVGRVWGRLAIEAATLFMLLPVLWFCARIWGFIAIPVIFFAEWLILVFAGELLLRYSLRQPVLSKNDVIAYLGITVGSLLGGCAARITANVLDRMLSFYLFYQFLSSVAAFIVGAVVSGLFAFIIVRKVLKYEFA